MSVYDEAGAQWDIDPDLLRALETTESHGNTSAVSPVGADGNMQFMPATARGVGVANTRDPAFSVFGAAKLLHDLREGPAQGDITTALRMYHGSPDRSKWGAANAAYAPSVFANLQKIKGQPVAQGQSALPASGLAFNPARMSDADLNAQLDRDIAAGTPAQAAAQPATSPVHPIAGMSDAQLQAQLEADVAASKTTTPTGGTAAPKTSREQVHALMTPGAPGSPFLTPDESAAFGAGTQAGLRNIGITANRLIGDPLTMLPGQIAARDAYNTQYGDSGPAQLGSLLSSTAATLPVMGAVNPLIARGAGAGASALSSAVPSLAPNIARLTNLLSGTAGAASGAPGAAVAARPLLSTLSNGANAGLQGAEAAAINSGQSDNPLASQMGWGALAGGAMGALPAAAGYAKNALTGAAGTLDPEMANLAAKARDMYGIQLKAPQLGLNPSLSYVNSTLKFVPGSGVGADEAATQAQWQQAVNREMGESGSKIFGTTVNSALKRAGAEMEAIGNRTNLNFNIHPTALSDLAAIEADAAQPISGLNESQVKQVKAHIDKIIDIAAAHGGDVPGSVYLNLIKRGEALSGLQNNASTEMGGFGNRIRGVLDDVMQTSATPADAAALQKARYQYKVARTVQPLTARSDSVSGPQPTAGDISPVALRQAVLNPRAFGPNAALSDWGNTPLWDLARIGQRMRDPSQSGTAPREAVQNMLTRLGQVGAGAAMGGTGFLTGEIPMALASLAGGVTAGRAIGAGLRSQTIANRLIDSSLNPLMYQAPPNPLARSALAALAGPRVNRLQPAGQ